MPEDAQPNVTDQVEPSVTPLPPVTEPGVTDQVEPVTTPAPVTEPGVTDQAVDPSADPGAPAAPEPAVVFRLPENEAELASFVAALSDDDLPEVYRLGDALKAAINWRWMTKG
jgi:hypothetical protein